MDAETETPEVAPAPCKDSTLQKLGRILAQHPIAVLITFLGGVASLLCLAFTPFFPDWFNPKRNLCYCLAPVRTPVIQTNSFSELSVRYKDQPITGNVSIISVAIWNAGKEPIKGGRLKEGGDFLTPVMLRLPQTNAILDVKIISKTREEIEFSYTNNTPSSVSLDWKILERKDGAVIQLAYVGSTDAPVTMEGTIVGQQSPSRATSHKNRVPSWFFTALAVSMFMGSFTYFLKLPVAGSVKTHNRLKGLLILLYLLVYTFISAALVWSVFKISFSTTPFGF